MCLCALQAEWPSLKHACELGLRAIQIVHYSCQARQASREPRLWVDRQLQEHGVEDQRAADALGERTQAKVTCYSAAMLARTPMS